MLNGLANRKIRRYCASSNDRFGDGNGNATCFVSRIVCDEACCAATSGDNRRGGGRAGAHHRQSLSSLAIERCGSVLGSGRNGETDMVALEKWRYRLPKKYRTRTAQENGNSDEYPHGSSCLVRRPRTWLRMDTQSEKDSRRENSSRHNETRGDRKFDRGSRLVVCVVPNLVAEAYTVRVNWQQYFRIVRSIFPPIDLFEDLANPADWGPVIAASVKEAPNFSSAVGNLTKVPIDRCVGGPGST